ncbi:MAG: 16S rRNA (uracil(1498)-N(3))-methyltransferase [Rickettsiales bacterium]|jgi:16S rRNA (uracil1498-N3)-methyltransferase|nr:16S rRNA (uracil(1498)-N(3))-methyltransferase [Rickettsiales bacterium]
MLPRIFINEVLVIDKEILLQNNSFHYLRNVLRCKIDDEVIFINGKDGEFIAKIIKIDNRKCLLKLLKQTRGFLKQNFLGLIFAPIQKIDILIKSATELGVSDFYPVKTEYTTHGKIERILPNVIEAVEQCERLDLPNIHKLQNLKIILDDIDDNSIILFCEERSGLQKIKLNIDNKKIYCLVGPEGGFSNDEKNMIKSYKNVLSVTLGDLILRTETATISILSLAKTMYAN